MDEVPNTNVPLGEKYPPMDRRALASVLGLTIKMDDVNKVVTLLGMLSAYTENSQLNISFNAPSSTGKSYIPTETVKLFPPEDVVELGYTSPTAFFHEVGEYSEAKRGYMVDLSRKIIVFLDQPHDQLLHRLRPILSHDKPEIMLKITDKKEKHGLRTKSVILTGFPVVIFCTAGLRIDEQEGTRFLMLSPEATQEKIRQGIHEKIRKEADKERYRAVIEGDAARRNLMERILAIKKSHVLDIIITNPNLLENLFFSNRDERLRPRHQRDVGRVIGLVKAFTLLNMFHRRVENSRLYATDEDIRNAVELFEEIAECQELNLPPFVFDVYRLVILPIWKERKELFSSKMAPLKGMARRDILERYRSVYRRPLAETVLRQEILPMLEAAGLVVQEPDADDKRRWLVVVVSE